MKKWVLFFAIFFVIFGVVFGGVYLIDCFIHNTWWANPLDYLGRQVPFDCYGDRIVYNTGNTYRVNVEGRLFIAILTIVSLAISCVAFVDEGKGKPKK